jgi:hypothetical protein
MQISKVYVPYYDWECFKNGMWNNSDLHRLNEAILFTGNYCLYGMEMDRVIIEWPNTMKNHLTNPSINKLAFIGHCAVCNATGISEKTTRMAWRFLTEQQRVLANNEAKNAYKKWLQKYKLTLKNGSKNAIKKEYQMKLFPL